MNHRFSVTFKQGPAIVAHILGHRVVEIPDKSVELFAIIKMEQELERLTGYRVHIDPTPEEKEDGEEK